MEFTHLSKNNQCHIYNINHDKIIRDDFLMNFQHPDIIKCDYMPLPTLTYNEVKAMIIELRNIPEFIDMARGFSIKIGVKWDKIRGGDKTDRVKELLKFIKRTDKIVI